MVGPRKSNVAPAKRAEKSTVRVRTTFNVVTKVILQNTISSQKIWKLTVSSREKPFERRSREKSRAYSELSYELVSKILFKRLCANYQFRIVLFSIESFDSWLCLLGKEKTICWMAQQGTSRAYPELSVEFGSTVVLSLEWICQNNISDNLFWIQVLTGDCVPLDNQKFEDISCQQEAPCLHTHSKLWGMLRL